LFRFGTTFNFSPFFIYSFVILPDDELSKVSLGHEIRPDIFGTPGWNQK